MVNLTADGVRKVEEYFHIENLADPENLEIQHNMILALRANNLMFRDKDYVVKDDEVLILSLIHIYAHLLENFERQMREDPAALRPRLEAGWCYLQNDECDKALALLEGVAAGEADATEYHNLMGKPVSYTHLSACF